MLRRLHKLQYEIRKPIPKGPKRVSNSELVTCLHKLHIITVRNSQANYQRS